MVVFVCLFPVVTGLEFRRGRPKAGGPLEKTSKPDEVSLLN